MKQARLACTLTSSLVLLVFIVSVYPDTHALPSYAPQTGQRCSSCHVGGNWPQLTPWGRFFKLSGYTAGKSLFGGEGVGLNYVPIGMFGQVGMDCSCRRSKAWTARAAEANRYFKECKSASGPDRTQ